VHHISHGVSGLGLGLVDDKINNAVLSNESILTYLGLGLGLHARLILGRDAELHHLSLVRCLRSQLTGDT
jgi:hypothetical protein